MKAIASFLDSW